MAFGPGGVALGALLGANGALKNWPSWSLLESSVSAWASPLWEWGEAHAYELWSLPLVDLGGIALACNQAFWQSKVPPDIQGKVLRCAG